MDLKTAEGIDVVKRLLGDFDILLENNRAGKMAALGLGFEVCHKINPRLVYVSVSGFGTEGTLRDRPAYDSIGQSISGFYSIMNDPEEVKHLGGATADLISGIVATLGALSGLAGRERTGLGTAVNTSLYEAMSALTIDAISSFYEQGRSPTRRARHGQAQSFCLPTSDARAITLHLSVSEKFWQSLIQAIERPDLAQDARFSSYRKRLENYTELEEILRTQFETQDLPSWEERLLQADVPFSPVSTIEDVVNHPQTSILGMLEPVRNGIALVRPPVTFNGVRPTRTEDAPHLGEHSREILGGVLSSQEFTDLLARGAIG